MPELELPSWLVGAAPWIALAAGVLALLALLAGGLRTWRAWRRTRMTQDAATALVDVHLARIEAAGDRADERRDRLATDDDDLAASLAELRADVDHLRWVLAQVPEARERLGRELFELVLPTTGRDDRPDA